MKKLAISLSIITFATLICSARTVLNFDDNWKFALGNASDPAKDFGCGIEYFNYLTKVASIHNEGPYSPKFDAAKWNVEWTDVDLPHDWVVDLPYAKEASHSHGYKTVGYKYPETSVGWYRKNFSMSAEEQGKHHYLQFDGIFRDARVWVNGFYLGHEPSGYATQIYDISEYLNYGGENLVTVRCDATLEEGWFYEGAGIYRHVYLTSTDPLHVAPFGTSVTVTFNSDYTQADINIDATIDNKGLKPSDYKIVHTLLDADGGFVAERSVAGDVVLPKASGTTSAQLNVSNPKLWSTDNPYMYKLKTEVIKEGINVDTYYTNVGLREVKFDADSGFLLNGKRVELKGVNMHQDHAGVGAGIPDALQVYRLRQLKNMGVNAYRASHNPMSPAMLNACDSLGILVIEENRLPGINEEHLRLLKRMIDRDRNHPSIILWSVGNEEWGIEWNDFGIRLAESLREYMHRLDPSRLMTVATSGGPSIVIPADVAGYNYILQNPVDKHRKDYPERKAVGSEETSGCGTRGCYYDDHSRGQMIAINRTKSGSDSIYNAIERGWKFYAERPWLGGLFYWTGFDYRGEPNPMVFPATGSQFGILDYCGFPKDEAYYLKSWWTDEPVLHLLPHWNLNGHEGEPVSVWAYSNCDEVQLTVNGKNLGRKKMPVNGHLEWDAVYQPGYIKAVGYKNGKKVAEEKVFTAGAPKYLSLSVEEEGADGVIVANLRVEDANHRLVPNACLDAIVNVEGDMRILGYGNGNPAFQNVERPVNRDAKSFNISTFNGYAQILLQKKGENGSFNVVSSGLTYYLR